MKPKQLSKQAKLEKLAIKYQTAYDKSKSPDILKKLKLIQGALNNVSNKATVKAQAKGKKSQVPTLRDTKSERGTNSNSEPMNCSELPGTSILIKDGLFTELPLSEPIAKAIGGMKFDKMTEIQIKSIPYLLEGRDLMASAKTGSGKTLAFLIPIVESMLKSPPEMGTGVIIISPTRELSMQTFGVLKELTGHTALRVGLVMGGTNRAEESIHLVAGVTILVATPGRLLDHLVRTDDFCVRNMKILVIDEADRMLDIGFEEEMKQIIRLLPQKRQTMFFSATLNERTYQLARTSLRPDCLKVGVDKASPDATVEGLEQGYLVCPPDKRFCLLYTFLKKNKNKKIMVFMAACMEVKFYYELLNFIDVPVMAIHGRQKQAKRTATFFNFSQAESAVLLCTDVAARGLDIPQVDWILQYDPPDDPKEYIHRVGRTARAGASGNALLLLRPHELEFLSVLKKSKVKVTEFEVSLGKLAGIQNNLEKLMAQNYFLNKSAQEAYKGLVRAYASSPLECFDIDQLELTSLGRTFGLSVPPLVDLNVHSSGSGGKGYRRGGNDISEKKKHLKATFYRKINK